MVLLRSDSDGHLLWIYRGGGHSQPHFQAPPAQGLPCFPAVHEADRCTLPDPNNSLKMSPEALTPPPLGAHTLTRVCDMWCLIWRPQVGQLARSRGVYAELGPEPGSGMDSESSVWGFSPCDWEGSCGRCAPCRCPCPCGQDIFSMWPMPALSLEPPCFGNSRALVTAQSRLFL